MYIALSSTNLTNQLHVYISNTIYVSGVTMLPLNGFTMGWFLYSYRAQSLYYGAHESSFPNSLYSLNLRAKLAGPWREKPDTFQWTNSLVWSVMSSIEMKAHIVKPYPYMTIPKVSNYPDKTTT